METKLFTLHGTLPRDPAIDAWFRSHSGELGSVALHWFTVMRQCGDEMREIVHDGCPVACLGNAPFASVNVFISHVNVGFFRGATLPDPARLLQGTGKLMRHVKLKPGMASDTDALTRLIHAAYSDMQARIAAWRALPDPLPENILLS